MGPIHGSAAGARRTARNASPGRSPDVAGSKRLIDSKYRGPGGNGGQGHGLGLL